MAGLPTYKECVLSNILVQKVLAEVLWKDISVDHDFLFESMPQTVIFGGSR